MSMETKKVSQTTHWVKESSNKSKILKLKTIQTTQPWFNLKTKMEWQTSRKSLTTNKWIKTQRIKTSQLRLLSKTSKKFFKNASNKMYSCSVPKIQSSRTMIIWLKTIMSLGNLSLRWTNKSILISRTKGHQRRIEMMMKSKEATILNRGIKQDSRLVKSHLSSFQTKLLQLAILKICTNLNTRSQDTIITSNQKTCTVSWSKLTNKVRS